MRFGCAITLCMSRGRTDDPDITHIEPFIVLSALAAVTTKLVLGTATLIPHRHPIYTALLLGSLQHFTGPGRVIAGIGLGGHDVDFVSIGMGAIDRRQLVEEQVPLLRQLWAGEKVDFAGQFYNFKDVAIRPVPGTADGIPIWYGGASKAAARRAVEFCDGWIASRMPRRDLAERVARMEWLAAQRGRERPVVGAIPYMSPGPSVEDAARHFNLPALCAAMKQFIPPPSGAFRTVGDLDGAAIAGPPEIIVEEIARFHALGVEHFVFDFRTRFADFEDCIELVGAEVLPALRRLQPGLDALLDTERLPASG